MNKLVAKIFAISIGVIVFLFSLLLIGTSVFGAIKIHSDINLSLEGFLATAGILFLFFVSFYFMWISYSILILKRITVTSMLILTVIPSIIITIAFKLLMRYLWVKPGIVLVVLSLTVFIISYYFITKILMYAFQIRTGKA